jgi:ABC-type nitrate/sulfonate/bicarbonate transport system ATPase subunit
MKIVAAPKSTVIMVTHDVDEAVLLSDRIVMMTNGPAATIGEILSVDLPRSPTTRTTMRCAAGCWSFGRGKPPEAPSGGALQQPQPAA